MHSSLTITDQVYGRLLDDDVRRIIGALADRPALDPTAAKLDQLLELIKRLQPVAA
jgi:hypothetical protein